MNRYIAILLLAFSGSAFAESYLCVGEIGAGIHSGLDPNQEKGAVIVDATHLKYKVWEISYGEWAAVDLGGKGIDFDQCDYFDIGEYGPSIDCENIVGSHLKVIGKNFHFFRYNAFGKYVIEGSCSKI